MNDLLLEKEFKEYVDTETGEIKEGTFISKEEIIKQRKAHELKIKRAKYLKEKSDFEIYVEDNFGSFYFTNYVELWKNLTKKNSALAFRFLYLCTYADFDNYLKFNSTKNDIGTSYMEFKNFKKVFNVSTGMTTKIKNELLENELVSETDDGRLIINDKYYKRGTLSSEEKKKSIRSFDNGIREIYRKSKPTEHKKLGLIIPLLDYVNIHSNIVCKNVNEKEAKYINPLNMEEICEIVGYDPTHSTKLKNILEKTTVNDEPMMGYLSHQKASFFVVNPAIFYKGKNLKELQSLINLFKVKNK